MKKNLSFVFIFCLTANLVTAQTDQKDSWSIDSTMSETTLKIELPIIVDGTKDTSLIKSPTFSSTIYTGFNTEAKKTEIAQPKESIITKFRNIDPTQISEANVRKMLNKYWNFYYQQTDDELNRIEDFQISEHLLRLIFYKQATEFNLILDKKTPSIYLNMIISEAFKLGQIRHINFGVLSQQKDSEEILFKKIPIDEHTFINPKYTFNDWVKSGFKMKGKKGKSPETTEVPE